MTRSEQRRIQLQLEGKSSEELVSLYHDYLFRYVLGDNGAELMYQQGYDLRDIREAEETQRHYSKVCDMIESICNKRNVNV